MQLTPTDQRTKALLWISSYDRQYLSQLGQISQGLTLSAVGKKFTGLKAVEMAAQRKGCKYIFTSDVAMLRALLNWKDRASPTINNYAGSWFEYGDLVIIIIPPLKNLVTVSYGKFLMKRYLSKAARPKSWPTAPQFKFTTLTGANADEIYARFHSAKYIAVDIETIKDPLWITLSGYCGVWIDEDTGKITMETVVIDIKDEWDLVWVGKFNSLPGEKILQNGKYDSAYFARFGVPLYNYMWDTANLFHSYYSELPKDLGFLGAFFLRKAMYWKDLGKTSDPELYKKYNALDCWGTANVFLSLIQELPAWAMKNYTLEFPLVFPAHMCEMRGITRDMEELSVAKKENETELAIDQQWLNIALGLELNVGSPKQVKQLLHMLGHKDAKNSSEAEIKKAMFKSSLSNVILERVLNVRKLRKRVSTYLTPGKEYVGINGRGEEVNLILYSLIPQGTDSGRLASASHHFWCGYNIQNQPRGKVVKRTYKAYEGFRWGENDLEQAESRDTAYIAGEKNLIAAVSGDRDFHSVNASAFFGVPYTKIYNQELHKVIDKALRDTAKRVNHGANYNMTEYVLIETMGLADIFRAARLLKYPRFWTPKQIAAELLGSFHVTYPGIRGTYYPWVINEVLTTSKLTGATGWTRYCFSDPSKSKRALNMYVAHNPQSLNAMKLNKAFMRVFREIALHPEHSKHFKLLAQIHDSILYQFREGHDHLPRMVTERMEVECTVKGCDGATRTYTVPAEAKLGKGGKGALYWSETE